MVYNSSFTRYSSLGILDTVQTFVEQESKRNETQKKLYAMAMKKLLLIVVFTISLTAYAQKTQVIDYGYNARGELHMIIQDNDTLINFYDASGNRITESQNIYSIDEL